jgi:hypothetical protein
MKRSEWFQISCWITWFLWCLNLKINQRVSTGQQADLSASHDEHPCTDIRLLVTVQNITGTAVPAVRSGGTSKKTVHGGAGHAALFRQRRSFSPKKQVVGGKIVGQDDAGRPRLGPAGAQQRDGFHRQAMTLCHLSNPGLNLLR